MVPGLRGLVRRMGTGTQEGHAWSPLLRVFALFGLLAATLFRPAAAEDGPQDPNAKRPVVSVDALLAEARSENKAARSLAIQKLGRLRDRKAVPFLVELLEDPDSQLRVLALEALATLGDPACLGSFLERFRDSQPVVVATAAREVVRFDPSAAVPALMKAMRHRTAGVRDQATRAFERLTAFETGFDPDGPTDQREQVIAKWEAWWEGARTLERVRWWITGLSAPDERLRKNSAMALRNSRSRDAIPALLAALTDSSEAVRLHAGIALSSITGLTVGYTPFLDAAGGATQRDEGAKAWRDWWARSQEAPEAEWYLAALRDPRPENRAAAAARLGELRFEPAVSALIDALGHESATVREQAFRALVRITGVEIPFHASEPESARKPCAEDWRLFWDLNRPRGRQQWLIDALLNGKAPSARASAARSLVALPTRSSIDALFQGLADPASGVRGAAFSSMQKLTGKSFAYSAEAPEPERRGAILRWHDWWVSEGKALVPR